MSSRPISDEEAVAAADKEMEERANRAKELLSKRYVGLKRQQVRTAGIHCDGMALAMTVNKLMQYDFFTFLLFSHRKQNRPAK